ncbi:site-specific DNA-methyltransferase [Methylophilus methylotrophus]|uniref:site-specific DNA-methyltransferase n=1 Tax=Methylophilus methylotrophus TaxID=17 RepID=UPI000F59DB03|nr:site-specific DNA-methyltransferase [Methylophilus methylotrophus]
MSKKQKLELTWIGKDVRPKLEPRILLEDPTKSYHAKHRVSENDIFDNRLIFGDNLLALKALEQEFTGKIKCIYIDPPYNTGSAFESYDDGVEHSIWLSLMRERLEILWRLLSRDNGTILISINDDECHYLKVLCDELFGRSSFVSSLVWNYEGNTDNQAKIINYHEYLLVYSKTGEIDDPGVIDPSIDPSSKLFRDEIRNTIIKNGPKNPSKEVLIPSGFPCAFEEGVLEPSEIRYPQYSERVNVSNFQTQNNVYATTGWSSKDLLERFIQENFNEIKDSKNQLTRFEITSTGAIEAIKKREQNKGHFISVLRGFGTTNQMRLFLEKLGVKFTYPKPVDLISYLIEAFSDDDDYILDSFAGSGTTAHAVMKLNKIKKTSRKFILVELREKTVNEVIIPRLKAIIDGNADAELEPHGGGFRYYEVAPSLLNQDQWGQWVINKEYHADMLAAAICKLEGFTFQPSAEHYWQHGFSTENDFIYVTTQTLTADQLQALSEEVGPNRTLLVCCAAFRADESRFTNLTIKKIPKMVLSKCEWGHDDYSLNVQNLPQAPEEVSVPTPVTSGVKKQNNQQTGLFGEDDGGQHE